MYGVEGGGGWCGLQVGKCRTPSQREPTLGTGLHMTGGGVPLGLGAGKHKVCEKAAPGLGSVLFPSFPAPPATLIPVETSQTCSEGKAKRMGDLGKLVQRRQMRGRRRKVRREKSRGAVGEPTGLRNQSSCSRGGAVWGQGAQRMKGSRSPEARAWRLEIHIW